MRAVAFAVLQMNLDFVYKSFKRYSCREDVVGGIIAGLEIWEVAVIPYLMNNSDTWAYMPKQALDVLDSLQNQFLRSLLATPRGNPTPALLWETGTPTMENRILSDAKVEGDSPAIWAL